MYINKKYKQGKFTAFYNAMYLSPIFVTKSRQKFLGVRFRQTIKTTKGDCCHIMETSAQRQISRFGGSAH